METTEQIIRSLVGRSATAVLQVRTAKGSFSVEARLLKQGDREGERGVWVRLAGGESGMIDRLIASAAPILAHVDDGPRRLTFVSSFLARRRPLLGGEQVLLAWPATIKSEERRRAFRERIPETTHVTASLIGSGVVPVRVWDLSTDGTGVICPTGVAKKLQMGDSIQIQLGFDGTEHRMTAKICNVVPMQAGQVRLGIGFVFGEGPNPTAEPLARFMEELRSERVRRSLNRAMVKGF